MRRGFTLIEVIIAVAVLGIAIIAAVDLTVTSNRLAGVVMRRFAAHHFAEEGLEIVRNMRDTNWLKNLEWRRGLADGSYAIQTKNISLAAAIAPGNTQDHPVYALRTLGARSRGESIPSAEGVTFSRLIQLSTPDPNAEIMHVKSIVLYTYLGLSNELTLESELSDWKRGPL